MKIKLKLKNQDEINKLLEVSDIEGEEGIKHTNGISWKDIDLSKTYSIKAIETGYDFTDILVSEQFNGEDLYISPQWVDTFSYNGKPFKFDEEKANSKYIPIGDKWYEISSGKIPKSIPSCPSCGVPVMEHELCPSCITKFSELHNYSHKPEFVFSGTQLKSDESNPVWYGIELEYALDDKAKMAKLVFDSSNSLYLKSDSSISGGSFQAELVSHPHSFKALTGSKSPLRGINDLDIAENQRECGCHIHISRSAFKSDKHFSLFYFLVNSNQTLLEFIGDRELSSYCSLKTSGRVYTKKNKIDTNGSRERVINEYNKDTVEVRFFNSTNSFEQVKLYLQFLESLIKYTNYRGANVSFNKWIAYINKYKKKYSNLIAKLSEFKGDLSNEVVFRAPVTEKFKFSNLTVGQIQNISSVTYKGDVLSVDVGHSVSLNSAELCIRLDGSGWNDLSLHHITAVTIEKD